MMLFSVCVIARNEEATLPKRLLPSLRDFIMRGGDVVLVDTGSTDRTVQVAKEGGFRVHEVGDRFHVKFDAEMAAKINEKYVLAGETPIVQEGTTVFNFAAARNHAASLAKNDVVLIADCDESFEVLDLAKLNALIAAGHDRMDIDYVHAHDESGLPLSRFRRSVLYNRTKIQWKGVVHEVIAGGSPILPPEDVISLHHWQEPNPNRGQYLAGLAYDFYTNPTADRQAHYFARELFYSGRYRSAIKAFKTHINMPNGWSVEQAQSQIYIGDCYLSLGDSTAALASWHKAFVMDGTRREPLMRLAHYFHRRQDRQKSVAYATAALTIPVREYYCNDLSLYRHVPHHILYTDLFWLGQKEEAKRHFLKCLEYEPDNPKFIHDKQFFA